jgi:glutaredoxin
MVTGADIERVAVVVNPGCHLCEDAVAVVKRVCAELGIAWRTVDLASVEDDARRTEWREMVPVILIDGAVHDIFRVDGHRLRAALAT